MDSKEIKQIIENYMGFLPIKHIKTEGLFEIKGYIEALEEELNIFRNNKKPNGERYTEFEINLAGKVGSMRATHMKNLLDRQNYRDLIEKTKELLALIANEEINAGKDDNPAATCFIKETFQYKEVERLTKEERGISHE